MKKTFLFSLFLALNITALWAQIPTEGVTYFLPKTALRFAVLVEKTTFTPGKYARFSERYLKTPVKDTPTTTYRIVGTKMNTYAVPDSSKQFTATIDKKHSIISVSRDQNGVIMAVNSEPMPVEKVTSFQSAPKPLAIDPAKYMTAEILAAGSNAKTAELIAQEIYDIRDSKNQLSRGEADFMPKDGEQLKIMLDNLNTQEKAMLQFFQGTTITDTLETIVDYVPVKETEQDLLFRFSKYLGMVDKDDLGGTPYYISIKDEEIIPVLSLPDENAKKDKNNVGINVNLPGKINITLSKEEQPLSSFETYVAQFGRIENISGRLWGKKFTTHLVLNPITGNVENIKIEALD